MQRAYFVMPQRKRGWSLNIDNDGKEKEVVNHPVNKFRGLSLTPPCKGRVETVGLLT